MAARPTVQAQRFGQSGSLNEGRGPKKLRGWRLLRGKPSKLLLLLLEFIFPKAVSSFFSMTTLLSHTLQDHRLCYKPKNTPMKKIRCCVQLSKSRQKLDIILEYKVLRNWSCQKLSLIKNWFFFWKIRTIFVIDNWLWKSEFCNFLSTFTQLNATAIFLSGYFLVLSIQDGPVKCGKVCVKSVVILNFMLAA